MDMWENCADLIRGIQFASLPGGAQNFLLKLEDFTY
jgi:hypothetical protein